MDRGCAAGWRRKGKIWKKVLQILSEALNNEFGKGFSVSTLTNIRKFYLICLKEIGTGGCEIEKGIAISSFLDTLSDFDAN